MYQGISGLGKPLVHSKILTLMMLNQSDQSNRQMPTLKIKMQERVCAQTKSLVCFNPKSWVFFSKLSCNLTPTVNLTASLA